VKTSIDHSNSFINIFSSITRILIVGILSLTIIYISAIYILSQRQAVHEIEELFDAQLAHSSNILFNLLGESVSTIDQSSKQLPIVYHGLESALTQSQKVMDSGSRLNALFYQKKVAYQIFNAEDKLLIKSTSAEDTPYAKKQSGFSRVNLNGEQWRVFSMYDEDWDFWLHVAESEYIREELARKIARQTLLPGLVLLPIILLALVLIIRIAVQPLRRLAANISSRDPKNLSPIKIDNSPKEITPVIDALNDLFIRLQDAIMREQRLTADAAHELRTPLSVVMIHAQNALAANNDQDRTAALQELEQGMHRISRLLEQLLTLSKINPETIPLRSLNIIELCQNMIIEMAPKIYQAGQEIEFLYDQTMPSVAINGSEFLLEILARNLIDNASRYSPSDGRIRISVDKVSNMVVLLIEDSGKGVDPVNYIKLTERFYREQQNQSTGAGLGLSLVNSIVEFHGAEMTFFKSNLGGLGVKICFSS
jgi:two-component system sensor histidine kinase QseC